MNLNCKPIETGILNQIKDCLREIELANNVVVIHAIESGSRAWGFPSPDSDYDVRFVYAHPLEWYLQLSDERDVIEQPISEQLDISGWDVRKALNLSNNGNTVIHEWLSSPIIYKQSEKYLELSKLVSKTFNPTATYHHYRSLAKRSYLNLEESEEKKLKRFFYFARAVLSAQWVAERNTMPSIVFMELVSELINEAEIVKQTVKLITQKATEPESSALEPPKDLYSEFVGLFELLDENKSFKSISVNQTSNDDFRHFLQNSNEGLVKL